MLEIVLSTPQAASCTMVTGSFPEVMSGRSVTLTPYPLLLPWSRKGKALPFNIISPSTNRSFEVVPKHKYCHKMSQRRQPLYAIKLVSSKIR